MQLVHGYSELCFMTKTLCDALCTTAKICLHCFVKLRVNFADIFVPTLCSVVLFALKYLSCLDYLSLYCKINDLYTVLLISLCEVISSLSFLGWEWRPEDRPSFAELSRQLNAMSDINESECSLSQ